MREKNLGYAAQSLSPHVSRVTRHLSEVFVLCWMEILRLRCQIGHSLIDL